MQKHLANYWRLLWINGIVLSAVLVPAARSAPGDAIATGLNTLARELSNHQGQQAQLAQGQSLNMGKFYRPDEMNLGCSMLADQLPTNIPNCHFSPPGQGQSLASMHQTTLFYHGLFQGNAQLYGAELSQGGSINTPVGLKCLREKKGEFAARFASSIERLETLLATYHKVSEDFAQSAKVEVDKIKGINVLLEGAQAGDSGQLDNKSINYADFFPGKGCRQALAASEVHRVGPTSGLRGIRDSILSARNDRALEVQGIDFNGIVQREIRAIGGNFDRSGFEGVTDYASARSGAGGQKFPGIEGIYQQFYRTEQAEVGRALNDLQVYLGGLGVSGVPALDNGPELERSLHRLQALGSSKSGRNWKDQAVNRCLATKIDTLLGRLQRRGFRGQSELLQSYRDFLTTLSNSQASVANKGAALEQFHQEKQGRSGYEVSVIADRGGEIGILNSFSQQVEQCEIEFSRSRTVQGPRGEAMTPAQAMSRSLSAIEKIQNKINKFKPAMAEAIEGRVLRCEGITYNAQSSVGDGCSGDSGVLNRASPSFCAVHSLQCANAVSACLHQLDNRIKSLTDRRQFYANRVNDMMQEHRGFLNTHLQAMINEAKQINASLAQTYPGVGPLQLEQGRLVISSLAPGSAGSLGVGLIDEGNPRQIAQAFAGFVDQIKQALNQQKAKFEAKIDQVIGDKEAAYGEVGQRWGELARQCQETASEYAQTMQQQNSEMQEREQELWDNLSHICQDTRLSDATVCEQDNLSNLDDELNKMRITLRPQDARELSDAISKFKQRCLGIAYDQEVEEEWEQPEIELNRVAGFCQINELEGKLGTAVCIATGGSACGGTGDTCASVGTVDWSCLASDSFQLASDYASYGLEAERLVQVVGAGLTADKILSLINDPSSHRDVRRELRRAGADNFFVRSQLKLISALAKKDQVTNECNTIRTSFINSLKNRGASDINLIKPGPVTTSTTTGATTVSSTTVVNPIKQVRKEILDQASYSKLKDLLKAQDQAQYADENSYYTSSLGENPSLPQPCEEIFDQRETLEESDTLDEIVEETILGQ